MVWTKEDAQRLKEASWDDPNPYAGQMIIVKGDKKGKAFERFRSPVDGSIITGHRELEEHNARNNVVDSREYSQEFYDRKAKEREAELNGTAPHIKEERRKDIEKAIYDAEHKPK